MDGSDRETRIQSSMSAAGSCVAKLGGEGSGRVKDPGPERGGCPWLGGKSNSRMVKRMNPATPQERRPLASGGEVFMTFPIAG
jgi:hypothetical protein